MEVNFIDMEEMIVASLTGTNEGVDIVVSKDDFVGGDTDTKLFVFFGTVPLFSTTKAMI